MALYYEPSPKGEAQILAAAADARYAPDLNALAELVHAVPTEQLVILGPTVTLADAVEFAAQHRLTRPSLGVVLLREQVDVPVLVEAIRSGIREAINSADVPAIRAACARSLQVSHELALSTLGPAAATVREGQLATVFAGKGGCGKSTVATNVAVALAGRGDARVLLVDLDLAFGDVAIMLQLVPRRTIADAVPMATRLDETGIRSLVTPYKPGLDTLLAPPGPAEAERVDRELVSEILKIAKTMYDYVVVDTPPLFSDQVLAALDMSTWYLLVATPDVPSLKNLRLTLNMFDLLEYPKNQRHVVLNRADSQVGLTQSDIDRVVRAEISGRIPSTRDVPVSINRGVPLMAASPNSSVSRCIQLLVDTHIPVPHAAAARPAAQPTHRVRSFSLRKGKGTR
jgi:pilus assembly protein CpaE